MDVQPNGTSYLFLFGISWTNVFWFKLLVQVNVLFFLNLVFLVFCYISWKGGLRLNTPTHGP